MESLFLVGFPRCGAGAVARGLRAAGYDLGLGLPPPGTRRVADAAVPRDFLAVNEDALRSAGAPAALRPGWSWHAELPVDVEFGGDFGALARLQPMFARPPWALWDPRLVWTLPIARVQAPRTRMVCLFREPLEHARALVEAARLDPVTAAHPWTEDEALDAWTRAYRRVLEVLARDGEWLFVHRDSLVHGDGARRIERFTHASFDATQIVPELFRERPADTPSGAAVDVYAELCARARHVARPIARTSGAPAVAAVVPVREGEQSDAARTIAALVAQRAVAHEVIAVDQTLGGGFRAEGCRVLREPSPSRGRAYRAALGHTAAPWIALAEPGCEAAPHFLARMMRAAAHDASKELWTCDVSVGHAREHAVRESTARGVPPGGWVSATVVRRERLATIDARAFTPAELAMLGEARRDGRCGHVPEALVRIDAQAAQALSRRVSDDAELLRLAEIEPLPAPAVTVLLALHDRADVILTCLEGFARQLVPPGTHEIVVIDDGSSDVGPDLVEALELAVPLTLLRQSNAGAASARNRGLAAARGGLLLFVNDDTIPFPDTVARHLAAHAELGDPRAIVLGTFEQPAMERDNALVDLLERTPHVFGYALHEPGGVIGGAHLYTCNSSVATSAVRAIGGFATDLSYYGEDTELGLRLERAGFRVHYRPEARALHVHVPTFDALRRRQRRVAEAHVRLFARHPGHTFGALTDVTRESVRELGAKIAEHLPTIERAARSMSGVDRAALAGAGAGMDALLERLDVSLADLIGRLDNWWWREGVDVGLAALGLDGFPEMLAARPLGLPDLQGAYACVPADEKGVWASVARAWIDARRGERRHPPLVIVHDPSIDPSPGAGSIARHASHRGVALGLHAVVAPHAGVTARVAGGASVVLVSALTPPALVRALRRVDRTLFTDERSSARPDDISSVAVHALSYLTPREPAHV